MNLSEKTSLPEPGRFLISTDAKSVELYLTCTQTRSILWVKMDGAAPELIPFVLSPYLSNEIWALGDLISAADKWLSSNQALWAYKIKHNDPI